MKRIITSGPQTSATVLAGSIRARATSRVTTPTWPSHSGPALSTVTSTSRPRPAHSLELVGVEQLVRARARRRAAIRRP